jgi:hypothetical protein
MNVIKGFLSIAFMLSVGIVYAQLNIQIKGGNTSVCANSTLILTDSVVSGKAVTYEWTSNVASFSSIAPNIVEATFTGSGDVILKTVGVTNTFYDTVYVEYKLLPSIILTEKTQCQDGGSIQLDDLVLTPTNTRLGSSEWECLNTSVHDTVFANMLENRGANIFEDWWLNVDTSFYSMYNNDVDTLNLALTYTNAVGCSNIDTTTVRLNKVPEINFSYSNTLCYDDGEVTLTDFFGVSPVGVSWTVLDSTGFRPVSALGGIVDGKINTLNSTVLSGGASPTDFLLHYTQIANGCKASKEVSLQINALPNLILSSLPNRMCETESDFSLEASPSGGIWYSSDSLSVLNDTFSPAKTTFRDESIAVFYEYYNPITGCGSIDSMFTQIDAPPYFVAFWEPDSFTVTKSNRSFTHPRKVQVENASYASAFLTNVYNNADRAEGTWLFEKDSLSIGLSNIQTVDCDTFRLGVVLGGIGACNDVGRVVDFKVCVIPSASIPNLQSETVNIFPNPSTGTFRIQGVQDYTISVRDLNGKLFQLTKLTNDEFYLPQSGLYFIELTNQDTGLRNVKKLLVK